ncbi:hypothetical protein N7468_005918 [Penicillium chermesinum]|uniref:Uncharacterized protein n=1 Tax=Penicillium chermesinum TaxID=63820 RepID=A0A9W9P2I9_9EURO|nr:uncharacterized protein N7468_005918 [Penicillium chermesinum]KAJ5232962.1 hypothetical protein N7468_005918 [Penicillium chermesinum]KAJ6172610.1 hypothetical protein N7470_001677 [Penicillium chermesinum]
MPSTFSIFPKLTHQEDVIVREYGGWCGFMWAIGLSPTKPEDKEKALTTIHEWAKDIDVLEDEKGQVAKFAAAKGFDKGFDYENLTVCRATGPGNDTSTKESSTAQDNDTPMSGTDTAQEDAAARIASIMSQIQCVPMDNDRSA